MCRIGLKIKSGYRSDQKRIIQNQMRIRIDEDQDFTLGVSHFQHFQISLK